VIKTVNLKQT